MDKQFATYKQSLALKELGFDEPCFAAYSEDEDNSSLFIYWNDLVNMSELFISQDNCEKFDYECLAPTFSQAFKWFRKEKDLYCEIRTFAWDYDKKELGFSIRTYLNPIDIETERLIHSEVYETYEEAESACIDKLIEIVKNK
jgi:hypothetical protein